MFCGVRRPHSSWAIAGAVLLAAPVSALAAQSERLTVRGDHVALYNIAGDVRVERGTGRDVEIEVTRRGRDAGRLRIEQGTVRGLPTVRVVYPDDDVVYTGGRQRSRWGGRTETRIRDDGTWGGNMVTGRRIRVRTSGDGLEAWADIRVRVPDGQQFDAYLLVGELSASDVSADLRLDVGAARVLAERTRGALDIDAGSGGVEVRDARATSLKVDNGSGGITLTDVQSPTCDFDTGSGGVSGRNVQCERFAVDVGSGGVRIENGTLDDVRIDTGSGGVTLELRRTPRNTEIDTGSGSVTLLLPASVDATLDIDTGSGGISTDFAVRTTTVERDRLRGTVGNGSARIRVDTGSGSVRLKRAQ